MNLMNQEKTDKSEKIKTVLKVSIIIAVVIFFIVLALFIYISIENSKQLKLYIDKKNTAISNGLLQFSQDSDKIYVSLKDMAKLVGYNYYNGEYNKYTEDQDKCYLSNKQEIAGLEARL